MRTAELPPISGGSTGGRSHQDGRAQWLLEFPSLFHGEVVLGWRVPAVAVRVSAG